MGDARAARELIGELLWDGTSVLVLALCPFPLPPPWLLRDGRLEVEVEGEELLLFGAGA